MNAVALGELHANDMRFRLRTAGSAGEPVILLHGFPETGAMWAPLMARLAGQGYCCLAPDQRGYSPGARPEGHEHYATEVLAGDVIALADAAGFSGRFHLVGHDWGAGVGWRVVQLFADRLASWTALSVPHPGAFATGLKDPEQQRRSQYIRKFQPPGLAEAAFAADDWAVLKSIWPPAAANEIEDYLGVLTQPGAMTAELNWYRAAFGPGGPGLGNGFEVHTPTLMLWGNRDEALGRATTLTHGQYMKGESRFVELDADHWLVQNCFDQVLCELLAHLRRYPLS